MAVLPPALVESLRLRQAVLVAGAGCSELAELPAWAAIAAALVDWVEEPERRAEVRALLDGGRALTALDDLWECALADGTPPAVALLPGQPHELDGGERMLLQLLGRAGSPESICLGPRDVRAKLARGTTGALLAEAHRRWSFVFVGFRPGDPDLALVAERLLGSSASESEDFLLCPGLTEAEAQVLGAELALTAIALEGDLAAALEALAEAWTSVKETSRPPTE